MIERKQYKVMQKVRRFDLGMREGGKQRLSPFPGSQPMGGSPILDPERGIGGPEAFHVGEGSGIDIGEAIPEGSPKGPISSTQMEANILKRPDQLRRRVQANIKQRIGNARSATRPVFRVLLKVLLMGPDSEFQHKTAKDMNLGPV